MVYAEVSPERICLPPGTVLRTPGTWQDYQALVERLGDRQLPRIKYRPGEILFMSPLPVRGRDAHLIARVVMELLDHQALEYEAFTPITMDLPEERGVEPDYCFYVDNWAAVAGKERIDWVNDPPPDLVIEIDVTSYTSLDDYLPYRVPEVWLFKRRRLTIYRFGDGGYRAVEESRFFPELAVHELVLETMRMAGERNTSWAVRSLRRRLTRGSWD